jgi:hypothetical protein
LRSFGFVLASVTLGSRDPGPKGENQWGLSQMGRSRGKPAVRWFLILGSRESLYWAFSSENLGSGVYHFKKRVSNGLSCTQRRKLNRWTVRCDWSEFSQGKTSAGETGSGFMRRVCVLVCVCTCICVCTCVSTHGCVLLWQDGMSMAHIRVPNFLL